MLTIERNRVVKSFCEDVVQFVLNMCLYDVLFVDPHLFTHHSMCRCWLMKVTELHPHALNLSPHYMKGIWYKMMLDLKTWNIIPQRSRRLMRSFASSGVEGYLCNNGALYTRELEVPWPLKSKTFHWWNDEAVSPNFNFHVVTSHSRVSA